VLLVVLLPFRTQQLRRLTFVVAIVLFLLFFVGLFVFKNTLGFSILTAQSLGKHENGWIKSKY